ncbi:uncharacterized protein LOC121746742 isoform X2 [Salvia splendens]|uniref:uncharacterized protein LOC121746742 isoform X2 n=1 Tax=Salvia splendens TaxID=180675 RepID=UPI001C276C97|nr:uncharacterized protein LOC121746742 isoform X2 [Salvia splendens]
MKQADQLRPWTLRFRARAKRFNFIFDFNYSKILPICKLRFKLRRYTFEFESKPQSAFSLKRKFPDLKFLRMFNCFRRKRSRSKIWLDRENCWFGRRKFGVWFWFWFLLFAVVSCFLILLLRSYIRTRFLWNFVWVIWNYADFLHQLFKQHSRSYNLRLRVSSRCSESSTNKASSKRNSNWSFILPPEFPSLTPVTHSVMIY